MKHLGDITKINGAEIEPVWCITGGSPCQDLSVAGKRKGLKHSDLGDGETTRSGLFMEQVRIVKEMRERDRRAGRPDELVRPRFLVWENVPGAFSSNFKDGFGDFGAVLEEIVRIAEPTFSLPRLQGKQKWTKSGALDGDGWSIAWRTHDAQYWGVPQRRRRISIVADFGGKCAGEISFECEGLRGNFAESGTPWKAVAGDATNRTGADDCEGEGNCLTPWDYQGKRVYSADGVFPTLYSGEKSGQNQQSVCVEVMDTPENCKYQADGYCKKIRGDSLPFLPYCIPYTLKIRSGCEGGGKVARTDDYQRKCDGFPIGFRPENIRIYEETATTICNGTRPGFCNGVIVSYDARGNGDGHTVSTLTGDHENRITDYTSVVCEPAVAFQTYQKVSGPLMANSHPGSYTGQDAFSDMLVAGVDCRNGTEYPEMTGTLQAKPNGGFSLNCNQVVRVQYIVRRLTPTECERLQGYPDHWTDIGDWVDSKGKKHKGDADSPRYKALGNSIALPFWYWMFCRMAKYLPDDATLGSLFDGIGGFPACWEAIHGKGTARWASEIEEFPIAVTKMRFPEEE